MKDSTAGLIAILSIVFVVMALASCGGGGVSDELAQHAIDRASLVRMVDDIANGK